jgi:hypothetical protein
LLVDFAGGYRNRLVGKNTIVCIRHMEDWVDTDEFVTETDRKRRILTRDDRKYLTGEKIIEGDKKYVTDQRIRERITGGVRDLGFLIETGNEDLLYSGSHYPPHVRAALASYFLESSLHYHHDHEFEWSNDAENPLTPVDPTTDLETQLERLLPKVLTDVPFASIDSVNVEITVEGTLQKKELLEEEMLKKQRIKEHKYDAWKDMGGQLDQLKSRLQEENKEVVIENPEPDVDDITITPDKD